MERHQSCPVGVLGTQKNDFYCHRERLSETQEAGFAQAVPPISSELLIVCQTLATHFQGHTEGKGRDT